MLPGSGEKRKNLRGLKASIPYLYKNSQRLYDIRHFDFFTAGSFQLKKPPGGSGLQKFAIAVKILY